MRVTHKPKYCDISLRFFFFRTLFNVVCDAVWFGRWVPGYGGSFVSICLPSLVEHNWTVACYTGSHRIRWQTHLSLSYSHRIRWQTHLLLSYSHSFFHFIYSLPALLQLAVFLLAEIKLLFTNMGRNLHFCAFLDSNQCALWCDQKEIFWPVNQLVTKETRVRSQANPFWICDGQSDGETDLSPSASTYPYITSSLFHNRISFICHRRCLVVAFHSNR
jgi:hypothetical protein